ncbi:ATP phosphoribosyltransferase regulatory subunit [Niabella ginsengisoli]|uniref:ATP phosphoribosyltransferase regulatory subunit n=1 Tax=Niabella ginsengisoli TaxID=522298 RepID=UPI0021D3F625|nr:ATP phosphoribosyltransferase regulatory subunit [Niabella ginsengisoli]
MQQLKNIFASNETGLKGIEELQYLTTNGHPSTVNSQLYIDLTLARGLNYYTGTILEIKAKNVQIGSIGGGGAMMILRVYLVCLIFRALVFLLV